MYKKLEELGFFEWLDKVHNLVDTDMKPEYLDRLPLDDIHRTVCNAMAFRWFREKHECYANLSSWIHEEELGIYHEFEIYKVKQYSHGSIRFKTYEEAENACIDKLIELTKTK